MIDVNSYIERLKRIGYSDDGANRAFGYYLSTGNLDLLDCYISKIEEETNNT